jgi:hypothetical protein
MQSRLSCVLLLVVMLLCFTSDAPAYVGPGSGMTAIGAALALVGGIFLAIVGFVWYPIKRVLFRFRSRRDAAGERARMDTAAR